MRLPVSRQSKVALAGTLGALIGLAALALAVWILSRADTGSDGGTAETDTGVVDTGEVETTPAPPPPEERTRTIEVGGFPNAVAVGQGSVWVVRDGRRVLRIDPGSGEVVARLGAGDDLGSERACGIAVGEGAIWVTTISGQVARLNPETNRLARLIAVEDAACVAVGARGVWVTSPNLGVVTRIDPATNEVVAEIDVDGFPEGIVTRFGSVWVANSAPPDGTGGSVLRINPGTEAVGRTIEIPSGPQYLAAGAGRHLGELERRDAPPDRPRDERARRRSDHDRRERPHERDVRPRGRVGGRHRGRAGHGDPDRPRERRGRRSADPGRRGAPRSRLRVPDPLGDELRRRLRDRLPALDD